MTVLGHRLLDDMRLGFVVVVVVVVVDDDVFCLFLLSILKHWFPNSNWTTVSYLGRGKK